MIALTASAHAFTASTTASWPFWAVSRICSCTSWTGAFASVLVVVAISSSCVVGTLGTLPSVRLIYLAIRSELGLSRVRSRGVPIGAQGRRRDQLTGPLARPGGPVLPPRTAVPVRGVAPFRRRRRVPVGHLVPGLGVGRVDDAGDVPAAGQHVPHRAAE